MTHAHTSQAWAHLHIQSHTQARHEDWNRWHSPQELNSTHGHTRARHHTWHSQAQDHRRQYSPRESHLLRLQVLVWMDGPRQVLLVTSQERPRCWVPEPQVTEHSVQSAHGDQPSSLSAAGRGSTHSSIRNSPITPCPCAPRGCRAGP